MGSCIGNNSRAISHMTFTLAQWCRFSPAFEMYWFCLAFTKWLVMKSHCWTYNPQIQYIDLIGYNFQWAVVNGTMQFSMQIFNSSVKPTRHGIEINLDQTNRVFWQWMFAQSSWYIVPMMFGWNKQDIEYDELYNYWFYIQGNIHEPKIGVWK